MTDLMSRSQKNDANDAEGISEAAG